VSQTVVAHEFHTGHEQCNWTVHFRTHARQNTTGQSFWHVCMHTNVPRCVRLPSETMRSSRATICIYLLICSLSLPISRMHVGHVHKCIHDHFVNPTYGNVCDLGLPFFSGLSLVDRNLFKRSLDNQCYCLIILYIYIILLMFLLLTIQYNFQYNFQSNCNNLMNSLL